MEFILSVLTGGATGIIGSVIGKVFGFVDGYLEEKKKDKEHTRTIEMTRLQSELRSQELESEREIVQTQQDGQIKTAAYDMFVPINNSICYLYGINCRIVLVWRTLNE